jgi:hypothetical protein
VLITKNFCKKPKPKPKQQSTSRTSKRSNHDTTRQPKKENAYRHVDPKERKTQQAPGEASTHHHPPGGNRKTINRIQKNTNEATISPDNKH